MGEMNHFVTELGTEVKDIVAVYVTHLRCTESGNTAASQSGRIKLIGSATARKTALGGEVARRRCFAYGEGAKAKLATLPLPARPLEGR